MKAKNLRKLQLKKQTIAILNMEVMDIVKGGTGSITYYPCELTDPNYTCATEEYCVTNSMCTHAQAICCEVDSFDETM
jgi:hypothetical protein